TIRQEFADGEEYVQRADHVIDLREDRVLAVNHRIGSGPLFREMNNRVRFEGLERGSQKLVIGNVSDEQLDGLACDVLPDPDAVRQRTNGGQRRSEEHTSELQSRVDLVCRLLLEKKKKDKIPSSAVY